MQQQFEEIPAPTVAPLDSITAPAEATQTTTTPLEATSPSQTEAFDALLATMEQETKRSKRQSMRVAFLMGCSLVLPLFYLVAISLYYIPHHIVPPFWPNLVYMAGILTALALILRNARWYRRYAGYMAQMEDVRAVGPMIDYLTDAKFNCRRL